MTIVKNFVKSFWKPFCKKLKYRGMYAVHGGDLAGAFFVHIEEENRGNSYALLLMPSPMESIYVGKREIKMDMKYENIKYVKKLPRDVYAVCKVNFIHYAKKAGIYANR